MSFRSTVSRILFPHTYSDQAYINYLRANGAHIGKNTRFIYPRKCHVDIHRAEYISIGDNCCLSQVSILAHDYSWYIALEAMNSFIPDPGGYVTIGNNCFVGYESLIMKNTTIGDNVIIGARSVVAGASIPSNEVWGGVPARKISTLQEYIEKKKRNEIEAIRLRKEVLDKRGSYKMADFDWFMLYFLPRTEENYEKYIKSLMFNGVRDAPIIRKYFFRTPPLWDNYESFLKEMNNL